MQSVPFDRTWQTTWVGDSVVDSDTNTTRDGFWDGRMVKVVVGLKTKLQLLEVLQKLQKHKLEQVLEQV